jgi:hypothetical protein
MEASKSEREQAFLQQLRDATEPVDLMLDISNL